MYKTLAVLRTVFLVFIVGYTVWTTTLAFGGTDIVAVAPHALHAANRATWLAIGWIAFETLVGWLLARRTPRRPATARAAPPAPPRA